MSDVMDEDGPVIEEVEDGDSSSDEDSESDCEGEDEEDGDFGRCGPKPARHPWRMRRRARN